jgi:zinc-finger binding domain of transposase IS66
VRTSGSILSIGPAACCGGVLHAIGETVSEMLDHVPARLRVIRICRPRYGCRPVGPSIRPLPRSVRSPRASPVPVFSPVSWSPSTAITFRFTGRAKSSPGTGSISIARLSRTGSAALVGGWSRCRPALHRMCLDRPSCLPMTPQSRCSIPAAAAPSQAGCGSMRATIDLSPDPNRRPPSISTAPIARQSVLRLISRASVVCCKSTAMLASSG